VGIGHLQSALQIGFPNLSFSLAWQILSPQYSSQFTGKPLLINKLMSKTSSPFFQLGFESLRISPKKDKSLVSISPSLLRSQILPIGHTGAFPCCSAFSISSPRAWRFLAISSRLVAFVYSESLLA
jgi:hypothetical protein